ncbi:MAG: tetraacyldisaccharide 4'-kinase [Puniceicoccales bacterium]|jgi:tetraacyldisaccharide 4'-kinase|nr:tetraacyldisaccharide 4'-kinase [Puniceicoccales bacterium]
MRWFRYWRLKLRRKVLRPLRHLDRTAEKFMTDILYGRRRSFSTRVICPILSALSLPFRSAVYARHFLYDRRILRSQYLGCVVISVGNLTVGGTGKTPVVELLARELSRRGRRVAILSRGYRSRGESLWRRCLRAITHGDAEQPRVVSDGKSVLLDSEMAGDEPHMLAKNLPGVAVITDKDRIKAGKFAINRFGCNTIILDDGFQYLRLTSQFNVLLVDCTNPFGSGHLLPRGILREPPAEVRRATHIIITKSDGSDHGELVKILRRHAAPSVPIVVSRHRPKHLCDVHSVATKSQSGQMALTSLIGKRVAAFSGIAVPEGFEKFLTECGATLVYKKRFPDHYRFQDSDVENVFAMATARGAELVVTTEKDAVRLCPNRFYPLPTYYLRMEIEIIHGRKDFQNLIGQICGDAQL